MRSNSPLRQSRQAAKFAGILPVAAVAAFGVFLADVILNGTASGWFLVGLALIGVAVVAAFLSDQ